MAGQKDGKSKEAIRQAIMDVLELKPKATLRSLKTMSAVEGGVNSLLISGMVTEDSSIDYGRVATLFTYAAKQLNPNVTEDDVLDIIDLDTIHEAMVVINRFYSLIIPEGLIPPEMLAEESEEGEGLEESKN